jgi:hypothetical protein
MRKFVWACIAIIGIGFIIISNDPLNEAANFIIGGSIPGTQYSIGAWSSLLLVAILMWVLSRGLRRARFQMLEHTAKMITKEQTDISKTIEDVTFDRRNRGVIAAPKAESSY